MNPYLYTGPIELTEQASKGQALWEEQRLFDMESYIKTQTNAF